MIEDESTAAEGVEDQEPQESVAEDDDQEQIAEADTEETSTESEDDSEEPEKVEELVEFNFGGNKLQLPKGKVPEELEGKIQEFSNGIWSDYTKKNQDLAERAKAVEAQESVVNKLQSLHGETLETYSQGLKTKAEIEQLSQIDVQTLWQSDPDQARQVSDAISAKQAEFNSIVSRVGELENAQSFEQEKETSRRKEEGKRFIEQQIKGFSEREKDLVAYAISAGIPKEKANDWPLNPIFTQMAYKAMLFDQAQAGIKKKTKPPQVVQAIPIKQIKSKGSAKRRPDLVKDADKMSAEEWARQRNEQLRKRANP
jgi:hypothetical protein